MARASDIVHSLWQIATADKIVTLMLDHMTNSSNVSHVPVKAGKGLSCLLSPNPSFPLGRGAQRASPGYHTCL